MQRSAESGATDTDTIIDFVGGVDGDRVVINTALLGGANLVFAGNAETFGEAQDNVFNGGDVGYVFQKDENLLRIDINNDGTLNADDIKIKLDGVTEIASGVTQTSTSTLQLVTKQTLPLP